MFLPLSRWEEGFVGPSLIVSATSRLNRLQPWRIWPVTRLRQDRRSRPWARPRYCPCRRRPPSPLVDLTHGARRTRGAPWARSPGLILRRSWRHSRWQGPPSPAEGGSQDTVAAISPAFTASTAVLMPSMPVTGTLPARPSAERLERADRRVVIGGPDALDVGAEAGEPGRDRIEGLVGLPVRHLKSRILTSG